jgi:hypothetical protein
MMNAPRISRIDTNFDFIRDSTAKRVLYRRDRRVRRAISKKVSALSAFSAMSFCSELIREIRAIRGK